ncbi:flavodoxin-dependent (E)-4-hydroxy-3-methylbut-2-enyl-diphosphate synthase [uncultured Ruminococcus sp.]|uniref:flavodoxin-dependent (E)-4-hydroxy-3-methylbut-2-enyl-diphosphate synthase n=1 Tax=uncultured Ruminococcus sp. TaxID=165186 RepID=UPI00259AA4C6|nr:flavodoxin-dependent (E)-4-hydroxy-3-methylbut-2-enyl-diphosphate synthase [uncultured Ruminococcus sp.]
MRTVKPVKVGDCLLDGKHIYIQSMLNRRSDDIAGSVEQALALEQEGCEIVRAAIPDMDAVRLVGALKEKLRIPLVADIHFDYRLAIEAAAAGVDKIRINPGNIGDMDRVRQVVEACKARQIPIRIGVNSGSLEKELLAKYGAPTPEALVESALEHVAILNQFDFDDIVISIKSSDVPTMIRAYRLAAQKCPYPLHLGVTEAGTERMGLIKSAIGIGALLADDIGETIRVSLTDDPIKEIAAARDILKGVGKRKGVQIVSCPTCGRTRIDLVKAAKEVEAAVANLDKDIKIAVMGCIVNGPGEAREADIGVAGGDGCAVIFKKDQCLRKIPESEIVPELLKEIEKL